MLIYKYPFLVLVFLALSITMCKIIFLCFIYLKNHKTVNKMRGQVRAIGKPFLDWSTIQIVNMWVWTCVYRYDIDEKFLKKNFNSIQTNNIFLTMILSSMEAHSKRWWKFATAWIWLVVSSCQWWLWVADDDISCPDIDIRGTSAFMWNSNEGK